MDLDTPTLLTIMPSAGRYAYRYIGFLNETMEEHDINTPIRVTMFLAQLAEESGQLRYVRELWGPTPAQLRYERDFTQPWDKNDPVNRKAFSLGNSEPGDGMRFMGRGLIQITGRWNYGYFSKKMYGDADVLLKKPDTLEQAEAAVRSAGAYWSDRRCNDICDRNDFIALTKRINGGLTHYDRRVVYLQRAQRVLGNLRDA